MENYLLNTHMSESDRIIDNTKFLYAFTQSILNSDRSIRWVGITDQNGIIINERDRQGLKPFLRYRRKSRICNKYNN